MLYQLSYVRRKPLNHTIGALRQWPIGGMVCAPTSDDDMSKSDVRRAATTRPVSRRYPLWASNS